ncbi:MAG: hypothetical protein JXB35_00205 [Anaerolineae bacterium]|nr:hypothetical protein [Anaerolineae bacterium]
MKRFLIVVASLVLFVGAVWGLFALVASMAESTLLADASCAPPCWNGIDPGKTPEWEAIRILQETGRAGSITQYGDPDEGGVVGWAFRRPVRESAGYLYSTDGHVVAINIMTLGAFDMGQALEKYGEPETLWLRRRQIADRRWIEVELSYPDPGIFIRAEIDLPFDATGTPALLDENTPIGRVIYYAPAYQEYLLASRLLFRESPEQLHEMSQPWTGLGPLPLPP